MDGRAVTDGARARARATGAVNLRPCRACQLAVLRRAAVLGLDRTTRPRTGARESARAGARPPNVTRPRRRVSRRRDEGGRPTSDSFLAPAPTTGHAGASPLPTHFRHQGPR